MNDEFETTKRILAINPLVIESLMRDLLMEYGVRMKLGDDIVTTLGVFQNTENRADGFYACDFGRNITPMTLTDGRLAFVCFWNVALAQAFVAEKAGVISYRTITAYDEVTGELVETQEQLPPRFLDVEEITTGQLLELLAPPTEMPFPV